MPEDPGSAGDSGRQHARPRDEHLELSGQGLFVGFFLLDPHVFLFFNKLFQYILYDMDDNAKSIPGILKEIVNHARRGESGPASSLLNRAVLLMQPALSSRALPPAVLTQVPSFLGDLLAAQKRGDWVGFADILEYSFIGFWEKHISEPH